MAFIEPCFGIGHNLSLICQMTSEDIKHQLIMNVSTVSRREHGHVGSSSQKQLFRAAQTCLILSRPRRGRGTGGGGGGGRAEGGGSRGGGEREGGREGGSRGERERERERGGTGGEGRGEVGGETEREGGDGRGRGGEVGERERGGTGGEGGLVSCTIKALVSCTSSVRCGHTGSRLGGRFSVSVTAHVLCISM